MAVILSRSADAAEYRYLTKRNAHLEDVNDYLKDRLADLEQRVQRLDAVELAVRRLSQGLGEHARILTGLCGEVHALPQGQGYCCARCEDSGTILVGNGDGDDPFDEAGCPVCDGREEPDWAEIDLDALEVPPEDKP